MDIPLILRTNYFGAQWVLTGNSYEGLNWLDKTVEKPSESELEAAWPSVQLANSRSAVEDQRRIAYTIEADPLNFTWQETQLESDRAAWLAKKDEIKARFPYPEES